MSADATSLPHDQTIKCRLIAHFEHRLPRSATSNRRKEMQYLLQHDLTIGRDDVTKALLFDEPTISSKHIQLHVIAYDSNEPEVMPLLYVRNLSRNNTTLIRNDVAANSGQNCHKTIMKPTSPPQLLNNGDTLLLSPVVFITIQLQAPALAEHNDVEVNALNDLQLKELEMVKTDARVTSRRIGTGGHGSILIAVKKTSNLQVACKVIDLHHYSKQAAREAVDHFSTSKTTRDATACRERTKAMWRKRLKRKLAQCNEELLIHTKMSHPNVLKIDNVLITTHNVYIFEELITGGDLFSYIEAQGEGRLQDAEATLVIRQLLEAVKYLHQQGIVHRDIKPENILITSWEPGGRIVLTDFGLAKRLPIESSDDDRRPLMCRMHTLVGTWVYTAPEVNQANHRGYDASVDLWAVGVVTAVALTGENIQLPNSDLWETRNGHGAIASTEAMAWEARLLDHALSPIWSRIATRPKDFIKKLLILDERQRMTAAQALQHSWFTKRSYRAQVDDIYKKAINGWKASAEVHIDKIDTSSLGRSPLHDESVLDEYLVAVRHRSSHFAANASDHLKPSL